MQESLSWIWLGVIVFFGFVEAFTFQLVSVWFCVGGIAALLVSLASENFALQLIVFVLVSAVALTLSRPLARRMKPRRLATNADMVLGQEGIVLTAITPGEVGRVKVDGQDWAARCAVPLAEGERCEVEKINGVTLTVIPYKNAQQEETIC